MYAGVDPANGDALYFATDGSTTSNYSSAPIQKVGNPNPEYTGGLNTTASYKGFDLNVLTYFTYGNQIYNAAGVYQSANADYFDNQTLDQLTRWQKAGDITNVPPCRATAKATAANYVVALGSGRPSFFRFKNVTLGYNLPATLVQRGVLQTVRVYLTARNLATITEYTGYDPEVNADGIWHGQLPAGPRLLHPAAGPHLPGGRQRWLLIAHRPTHMKNTFYSAWPRCWPWASASAWRAARMPWTSRPQQSIDAATGYSTPQKVSAAVVGAYARPRRAAPLRHRPHSAARAAGQQRLHPLGRHAFQNYRQIGNHIAGSDPLQRRGASGPRPTTPSTSATWCWPTWASGDRCRPEKPV
ncbi:MAG: hypothetical protein WKG07_06050 [Hymenobacter sp.]